MLVRNIYAISFLVLITACGASNKQSQTETPAESNKVKDSQQSASGYTTRLFTVNYNVDFSNPAELGNLDPFVAYAAAKGVLDIYGPKSKNRFMQEEVSKVEPLVSPADNFQKYEESQASLKLLLESLDKRSQSAFVKVAYYNKNPKVSFVSILQKDEISHLLKLFTYPLELVDYSEKLRNSEINQVEFQDLAGRGFVEYLKASEVLIAKNLELRRKVKSSLPPL